MLEYFPYYLGMILLIVFLMMLGNKIKVAYPVLLVLAGLVISLIPAIPVMKIDPELIFIIFLPPLLYEAAWNTSWKELWHWRRIIFSFAFIVVFLTAISVALVANYFIPGFSLALGFLLGGIVSPPDAVSASAILKFVKVPKRMSSILEGESLLNDASSLIIFRFAMVAVATGQFIWQDAVLNFGWMVIGGISIGLAIAIVLKKTHKYLPTDVNMDIILTLMAPYIMYIIAEQVHSSGVLAVVSGGLFMSYYRHTYLSSSSRLRAENVWQSFAFLLNGLVFMLIGLDLPEITLGLESEGVSFYTATGFGLLITAVLIIGRILACYGAIVVTLIMRNFITVADRSNPGLKGPLILGWTGMRGVVSLAAALSIPLTLEGNVPFPHRNLILYITFIVILLTLVVQGLTLPYLIKKMGVMEYNDHWPEEETHALLRTALARESLDYLSLQHPEEFASDKHLKKFAQKWEDRSSQTGEATDVPEHIRAIYIQVLNRQRSFLIEKNKTEQKLDEEIIRHYLHQIDLEEERILYSK